MIPIATLLTAPSRLPIAAVPANRDLDKSRTFDENKKEVVDSPSQRSTNQQIIAGMALDMFFADTLHLLSFDERLIKLVRYATQVLDPPIIDGLPEVILKAKEKLLGLIDKNETIRTGKGIRNLISDYTSEFANPSKIEDVVSFSKEQGDKKVIVIYNISTSEAKEKFILMHNHSCIGDTELEILYGYKSCGNIMLYHSILDNKPISYIKMHLDPMQLVILKN